MQKNQQGQQGSSPNQPSQGRNDQQSQSGKQGQQTPSGGSNQQNQSGGGRDQQGGNLKSDPGQAQSRSPQQGGDHGNRSDKQR